MKNTVYLLVVALVVAGCSSRQKKSMNFQPFNAFDKKWQLVEKFSDEFNSKRLDTTKWENNVSDWGVWSWEPNNARLSDGDLHIRMEYAPHVRRGKELFYKSGIIKSWDQITYGYFEARIKGCPRFPGVCPAFWMKGDRDDESSEIDFMEIEEVQDNIHQIDCNLWAFVKADSSEKATKFGERRDWIAPWDPREEYHIYACENTLDSIRWIIDGKHVLSAPNTHFHLPMNVMLSMGVRAPLRKSASDPDPEASTAEGFPTEMLVDYVRVWTEK